MQSAGFTQRRFTVVGAWFTEGTCLQKAYGLKSGMHYRAVSLEQLKGPPVSIGICTAQRTKNCTDQTLLWIASV